MTTKTKIISSLMPGAPVLNGVPGSMLGVLSAVLETGLGLVSATALSVTDGLATLTLPTGHSMIPNCVALIAGATPAGLNGEKRIISTSATSATFDATGVLNGAATGSITVKVAALGWVKSFTGANVAAYKMTDVEGSKFSLRVDDTGTTAVRVRGYEVMMDVDTGTGLFPSLAQIAGPGLWWSKSNAADATPRAWYVIGDSRGFYLFVNNYGASSEFQSYYFGDVLSLKSNDPYACVLRAHSSDSSGSTGLLTEDLGYADGNLQYSGMYIARPASTLGGSVQMYSCPTLTVGLPLTHPSGGRGAVFPSTTDNGLMLGRVLLATAQGYRGYFPGLMTSPQFTGPHFSTGDYINGSGEMAGRKVCVMKCGDRSPGINQGVLFLDPISDWRG